MEDFMPTKTKASQNKKTTHSGVKQNAKASAKKHTYTKGQGKKTIGHKNSVKKETLSASVQKPQVEDIKTDSVQAVEIQQNPKTNRAEPVVTVVSSEEVSEQKDNSVWYVVLLLACLVAMIVGIRLTYLQQGTTQSVIPEKKVLSNVQISEEKNDGVVSSVEKENEQIIVKTAETIDDDVQKVKTEIKTQGADVNDSDKYTQGASEVPAVLEKILADNSYPVLGNPDGKYIIVDFFDYTCQWCKKTNYMLDKYITDGKAPNVRLIVIPTPVMGDQSIVVSAYALASIKQNKFAEFHQALTQSGMTLSLGNLNKIAESVGLNVDQLNQDVDNIEIFNQLEKNRDLLMQLKAKGIPYLIVNGELHAGALVGENLRLVIEQSNQ